MAIQILASAEQIGTQALKSGDYVIYEQTPRGDVNDRWITAQCGCGKRMRPTVLGAFPSKANALTFALAHESTGWEDDGALYGAAQDVIHYCSLPEFSDALQRLALALKATASRRPRVLVVVEHGMARVQSTAGVDAVVLDLDARQDVSADELLPVHSDFADLLKDAGVDWPLSPSGRVREPTWRNSA